MKKLYKRFIIIFFTFIVPFFMIGMFTAQMMIFDSDVENDKCIDCVPISMRAVYLLEDQVLIVGGIQPEIAGGMITYLFYGMEENVTSIYEAAVTMQLLSGNDLIHPVMTGAPVNYTIVPFSVNNTENMQLIENLTKNIIEMKNETGFLHLMRDFPLMEIPQDEATIQILEFCPEWSVLMVDADGLQDDGMYSAEVFCENQTESFTTFLLRNNIVTSNYTMCGTSEFTEKYCP